MCKMNKIFEFLWCPSHVGIQPNEFVDSLVKQATEDRTSLNMGLTYEDAINSVKNNILNCGKILGLLFRIEGYLWHSVMLRIGSNSWFHDSRLYRKLIVLIVRLRMGHAATPRKYF